MKKGNQVIALIMVVIFLLVGVKSVIGGISQIGKDVEVTAVIDDIQTSTKRVRRNGRTRRKTVHNVYVNYEYNGKRYDYVNCGKYNSSMYEGQEIIIKINKDKPDEMYNAKSSIISGIIFIVISGTFIIVILRGGKNSNY